MIEFLTLLLGLATGPQTVELTAAEETAKVQLLLNGVMVATDTAPAWKLDIDLGTDLRPHLLEAIAIDADGNELGRATQRLNLPRPPAEARVRLERSGDGQAVAALLTWESSVRRFPGETRAWFDGEPLETSDPSRIPLPSHDPSQLHLFQVELEFSTDVIAETQVVFGGLYLDEANTDLTALPVVATGKSKKAKPVEMTNWFQVAGEPAQVVAFEKGNLDLVIVRGPGTSDAVRALEGTTAQPVYSGGMTTPGVGGIGDAANIASTGVARASERLQQVMALEPGQRLRLLLPRARSQAGRSVQMEVFALSPEITADQGGLYWALQQRLELPGLSNAVRIADAVAVAGLQAANANRRRAVLLVLADEVTDESRHRTEEIKNYLASLHVPLFVWRIGETGTRSGQQWGVGEEIEDFQDLRRAARQLSKELDSQRIAWLEGRHLPDTIQITLVAKVQSVVR